MVDIAPRPKRRRPTSSRLASPVDEVYYSAFSPAPVTLSQPPCATSQFGKRARLCRQGETVLGFVFPHHRLWTAVAQGRWASGYDTIGAAVDHLIKQAKA